MVGEKRKGTFSPIPMNRCMRGTDPSGELVGLAASLGVLSRKNGRGRAGKGFTPNHSEVFQPCGADNLKDPAREHTKR